VGVTSPAASKVSERLARPFRGIRTLESLHVRDFRLLWITGWCTNGSSWVENVVLGWLTFQVTQSALLTTLSVGVGALPSIVIGPLGGVYIDRWNRQKLLVASIAGHAVLTAAFTVVVLVDAVQAWNIFLFILLNGGVRTLRMVIESSLVANTVPSSLITNAFSLFMLTASASRFIVPATTGLLIVLIGSGPTLVFATLLYVLGFVTGLRIESRQAGGDVDKKSSPVKDLIEAARYLWFEERRILAIYALPVMLILFIAPVNIGLMPVYVSEVFDGGPALLGFIVAALGAGMTLGTLLLATIGEIRFKARAMVLVLAGTVVGVLVFSQITFLPLALVVVVIYSVLMVMMYVLANAAVQSILPDHLRGRVTALLGVFFIVFPLGTLIVGSLAEEFGAQRAVVVSATALGATLIAYVTLYRRIWTLQ
jgi:MFS family permease